MRVDVVVDLQFGSTAKGKVCALLAQRNKYDMSVRVQSIQAGHTVYYKGKAYKMRTIPCAWVDPNVNLVLGAGCFIEKELLLKEIAMVNEAMGGDVRDRLYVDYRATYIVPEDFKSEASNELTAKIGSTSEGAGASLIRKIWRKSAPTRVCDDNWTKQHSIRVTDTIDFYSGKILLEGCQGTLLSVHSSPYYPFCTSRECTVSGIASEAGIAPHDINRVYGVFRTYPIRVGGNSGDTGAGEVTWDYIKAKSGNMFLEPERTTVTNRERRIFKYSVEDMKLAIKLNKPTNYCLTFLDYLNYKDYGQTNFDGLSEESKDFIKYIEDSHGIYVDMLSTGELHDHIIWR